MQHLSHFNKAYYARLLLPLIFFLGSSLQVEAQYAAFTGEKTSWHNGFDRYDFVMDENTLAITPYKAAEDEKFGVKDPEPGKRRCIVIVPKKVAPGNPWSWRGCYWDHQPQTEIELLNRGFHVVYISANATLKPGKEWDAWYDFLTAQHGLSKKPVFIGMSRGGEYELTWATTHPDKVSAIYADNPAGNRAVFMNLVNLAASDVPLLFVCGSVDPLLPRNALAFEKIYQQYGGRASMMIKDGFGHHPHSLRNPKPIADFLEKSVQPVTGDSIPFPGNGLIKTSYYSHADTYAFHPEEQAFITTRGPAFNPYYQRYVFGLEGVEASITVIAPAKAAPGKPWVYRADMTADGAVIDQALLAKGFHIVTGPVPYNGDGPVPDHWDKVYQYFTAKGFSMKPVIEGISGAIGASLEWAIANPDKVSAVYTQNPIFESHVSATPMMDRLEVLAKAGVPMYILAGSNDPSLNTQTRVAEQKYNAAGGKVTVMVEQGAGHDVVPTNIQPVVDFILKSVGE